MKKQFAVVLVFLITAFSTVLAAASVYDNTASAEEIAQALNGVEEAKAQAIIAEREANGPFKSADDLARVKGIGSKTVEKNKEDIQL